MTFCTDMLRDNKIFNELNKIFLMDVELVKERYSHLFYVAFKDFFEDSLKFERYCMGIEKVFKLCNAKDKKVLDVGCGFGFSSLMFSMLGVEKVVAIDTNVEMITVLKKIISEIQPPLTNIQVKVEDAIQTHLDDCSIDVVIANDVISHVRDIKKFIFEIRRILRPNGILYIFDGNNSLSLVGRFRRFSIWRKIEYGPSEPPIFPLQTFYEMRKSIIKSNFPDLDERSVSKLSKMTRGLYGDGIIKAVSDFLKSGKRPVCSKFVHVDPRTGERVEYALNPYSLKKTLDRFEVTVIHPFTCFTYPFKNYPIRKKYLIVAVKDCLKRLLKFLYPFNLLGCSSFEILAIKKPIDKKTERLEYQEYYEKLSKAREQFLKEFRESLCEPRPYDVFWGMKNIYYKAVSDYIPKQDYLSVLDIGCGQGEDLLNISKRKKIIGYGLDWSLNQLKIAKQSMNFEFIQADAEKLPFRDSTFDLVISSEVIEHLLNPQVFVKEAFRIIKPQGKIAITTPNKYNYFTLLGKIFPVRIRKRLSKAIRGKLDIDSSEYGDGEIKEHLREFSVGKLKHLLSQRGVIIKTVLGSVLAIPFPRLFEKLPLFYKLLFYIDRFIDRLPFSNYLKAHIIIVAEKPS